MRYLLGVDCAQTVDYMAVALVEPWGTAPEQHYNIGHLQRFEHRMPYPQVVERLAARLVVAPLAGQTEVVLDATGLGRPVFDLLDQARVAPVVAVTLTSGTSQTWKGGRQYHVSKLELVTRLVEVFQERRVHSDDTLPWANAFREELRTYEVRLAQGSGYARFGAFAPGAHDDLVTAVALCIWRGEHPPQRAGVWGDPSPSSSVRPERGSAGRTVWDTDPYL